MIRWLERLRASRKDSSPQLAKTRVLEEDLHVRLEYVETQLQRMSRRDRRWDPRITVEETDIAPLHSLATWLHRVAALRKSWRAFAFATAVAVGAAAAMVLARLLK